MAAEHFTSALSKRRKSYFIEVLFVVDLMCEEDEERKPEHLLLTTMDLGTGQKLN